MMEASFAEKHYRSAQQRSARGRLTEFFLREFPRVFGPTLVERIVEELQKIIEEVYRDSTTMTPGQCLWLALDATTRGDSVKRKLRAVVLTLTNEEDATRLASGVRMAQIRSGAIARIMREAYSQGALLSMRDIELLSWRSSGGLTSDRQQYEREHDCVLPHTGSLQDMGSTITHKRLIVEKLRQGTDPLVVARQTNHTLRAVERYGNDYQRVKQCYTHTQSVETISKITGIAAHVVKQYIELIELGTT